MRLLAFGLALAGLGTMAAADCPQADDLAEGIYVGYDDDSVTRYYSTTAGEVIEDTMFMDGSGNRFVVVTLAGLFELSFVDMPGGIVDETSRESSEYAGDLTVELPVQAGQMIDTAAITTYADGSTAREAYKVAIEEAPDVTIGDCRYRAFVVEHTYVAADGVFGIQQRYLPELGIALYDGTTEEGAEPETYAALWISDLAP
jgi:hypothetical protein